jgi:hypothetical protein
LHCFLIEHIEHVIILAVNILARAIGVAVRQFVLGLGCRQASHFPHTSCFEGQGFFCLGIREIKKESSEGTKANLQIEGRAPVAIAVGAVVKFDKS